MANRRSSNLYKESAAKRKALRTKKKALKTQKKKISKETKTTKKIKRIATKTESEITRQLDIYSSLRRNTISKIQRVAKKSGITIPSIDLNIPTARSIKARIMKEVTNLAAEAIAKELSIEAASTLAGAGALIGGLPGAVASMALSKIFEEAMEKITNELAGEIYNYESQLEDILTDLKGGEIPDEAEKLYAEMKGVLLKGKSSSDTHTQKKAKLMYEYTIKYVESGEKGTWMKYALRFKNYLPDITSIVDKYTFSSGQTYSIYAPTSHVYTNEERYHCWETIIRIFYEDIYNDEEFREWLEIATDKEKKVPSQQVSKNAYSNSPEGRYRFYNSNDTADRRFAIETDISDLMDVD